MKTLSFVALPVLTILAWTQCLVAQGPESLSVQGYLADSSAVAVDTPGIDMTFTIYRSSTQVWTKTYPNVPVNDGLFNVILSGNSLSTVPFNRAMSLGITVGGDAEMSPRTPLVGTAFARALPGMYTYWETSECCSGYNVVGGDGNSVMPDVVGATISGGGGEIQFDNESNEIWENFGTIGGGYDNQVWGWGGTVAGGANNGSLGRFSMIPGGRFNRAFGDYSFAAGQRAEAQHAGTFVWADSASALGVAFPSTGMNQFLIRASGGVGIGTNAPNSQLTVSGDSDFDGRIVVGGQTPRASITVRGPDEPHSGPVLLFHGSTSQNQTNSGLIRFVEGFSNANYRGAYIHYDGLGNKLYIGVHDAGDSLLTNDRPIIAIERASGDVGIKNVAPNYSLQVGTSGSDGNGAHVTDGGVWTNGSSRTFKEDLRLVDNAVVLESVTNLPVYRWRYKNSEEGEHMGPVAEDFYESFGLGNDDRYIGGVDGDGVALAAIQGLYELVKEQQVEISEMRAEIDRMRARLK